jgi:hypothetical protein
MTRYGAYITVTLLLLIYVKSDIIITTWPNGALPANFSTYCVGTGCIDWSSTTSYVYSGNGQPNSISTYLQYSFILTDWRKLGFVLNVSAEAYNDYGSFYIDGVLQSPYFYSYTNGEIVTYAPCYQMSPGNHTIYWEYSKDPTNSFGLDQLQIGIFAITTPDKLSFNCSQCIPTDFSGNHCEQVAVANLGI